MSENWGGSGELKQVGEREGSSGRKVEKDGVLFERQTSGSVLACHRWNTWPRPLPEIISRPAFRLSSHSLLIFTLMRRRQRPTGSIRGAQLAQRTDHTQSWVCPSARAWMSTHIHTQREKRQREPPSPADKLCPHSVR